MKTMIQKGDIVIFNGSFQKGLTEVWNTNVIGKEFEVIELDVNNGLLVEPINETHNFKKNSWHGYSNHIENFTLKENFTSTIQPEILNKIKVLGENYSTSLSDVLLKIQEELGETSAEHLRCKGIKPDKEGEDPIEQRFDEACDLLMCVLDYTTRLGTMNQINNKLREKLKKWENYQKVR